MSLEIQFMAFDRHKYLAEVRYNGYDIRSHCV